MRIAVRRTGGFAGLTTRWAVDVAQPELRDVWMPLIDSCPWDDVPEGANQPDRYVYSISAGERQATLPERHVTGPWRALVDRTRDAARVSGPGGSGGPGGPEREPALDQDEDVLEPERPVTEPSRRATEPGQRLFPPQSDG
jgi:hypothetical protein